MIQEDLFTINIEIINFINQLTLEFKDGIRMAELLRAIISIPLGKYECYFSFPKNEC